MASHGQDPGNSKEERCPKQPIPRADSLDAVSAEDHRRRSGPRLACAVGVAIGGMLAPAKATAQGEERTAHLCHQFHCPTGCNLKCTIRDERITLIEPSDIVADKKHSTICLRGIGELSHIYAQDRLKVPLKRVGERGAGEFEQISWDEAIKTIADNLKEAQQKYGEGSVFIRKSTEAGIEFDFITQLLHADSGGNWGLDRGQANGTGPAFGPPGYLSNRSRTGSSRTRPPSSN